MKVWLIAAVAVVIVGFIIYSWYVGYRSPQELARIAQALRDGALLVDVRTDAEFGSEHLANAVNIPLSTVLSNPSKVGAKDRPVVLYCRSGSRSATAARALRQAGYATVLDLGGIGNGARLPEAPPAELPAPEAL